MATAELNAPRETSSGRRSAGLRGTLALTYLALWAATLAAAAITRALALTGATRALLGLRLSPAAAPTPLAAAALAAHNLPICAWPLLLASAGTRGHKWTLGGHALVVAALSANATLVGAALGAYGTPLLPFIPQLPLEWLALACGASGWLARRVRYDRRARLIAAALVVGAVLAAATVEAYATPHRQGPARGARSPDRFEGGSHGARGRHTGAGTLRATVESEEKR